MQKSWEEMTNREKAEMTFRDIKRKQELKAKGESEAITFSMDRMRKTALKKRNSKRRGPRSL